MSDKGLSIGDVAAAVGVSPTLLRSWERRYRVAVPRRDPSGVRRYGPGHVAALQQMKRLMAGGMPPRRAAAVVNGDQSADGDVADPLGDAEALVRHARSPQQLRRVVADAFGRASFEAVVDSWLLPALRKVGDAWAAGELDVADEHLVSGVVQHQLGSVLAATPSQGPRVLVGLPQEARHELPALVFTILLRRLHCDALHLGPDLPTASWGHAVRQWRPQAVVLAMQLEESRPAAQAAVDACRAAGLQQVFVGGSAAAGVAGAQLLDGGLVDSALVVAEAVAGAAD